MSDVVFLFDIPRSGGCRMLTFAHPCRFNSDKPCCTLVCIRARALRTMISMSLFMSESISSDVDDGQCAQV